ncbi:hypothetical protein GCM10027091_20410 [Streptomyces daliensis]
MTALRREGKFDPLLALQPWQRFAKDVVIIVAGTSVPTRDHQVTEGSPLTFFQREQPLHMLQ